MRILTLVWSLGIGGTERAAANYAISYKQHGLDSRVLILGEGVERVVELAENSVPVVVLRQESDKELALQNIRHWKPEIIHIHNFSSGIVPYIKKIKSLHSKVVETNVFSRPVYSPDYKIVCASLQLSEWGLWKYVNWMRGAKHYPAAKVVPYIVLTDRFKKPTQHQVQNFKNKHNIPEGAFTIGRLGQPHPSKWSKKLIDVVKGTVKHDGTIYYLLVGVPAELRKSLERCGESVTSRVRFIDRLNSDDELSLYYHSLEAFAHISAIGESFGYVLAEAMACHVPVVTLLTPFKDNAQYEIVGHHTGGICVTNTKEFVSAVKRLASDKAFYAKFAVTLKGWVLSRFSPKAVLPELLCFYEKLLNENVFSQSPNVRLVKKQFSHFQKTKYFLFPLLKFVHNPILYKIRKGIRP